jgi:DNA modification methylase
MLGPYELNTIMTGDARELAKAIPDESVDLLVEDPPYGISYSSS